MKSKAQNEREKEQANTRLPESLVGFADCKPPISEPHSQRKTDSLLIFQTGKPQRNVSDEPSNSPLCQPMRLVFFSFLFFSVMFFFSNLIKKKEEMVKEVMKCHNGCSIYHRVTAVI